MSTTSSTATITVNGMTCGGCATKVSAAVESVPGITGADVDLAASTVTATVPRSPLLATRPPDPNQHLSINRRIGRRRRTPGSVGGFRSRSWVSRVARLCELK